MTRALKILSFLVLASPLPAQVVATSGGHQLTQQMLNQALQFGQLLAGAQLSPADAAALRADLITYFQRDPAKQLDAYASIPKASGHTWFDLALDRYRVWQAFASSPTAFRDFQNVPFGKMVLKYNPVIMNSGGMIITKTDVECQAASDSLVAQIARVAAPTQSLPSHLESLPREQQDYLSHAELRLVNVVIVYGGTIKTHALVEADIRNAVHATRDVWREARQVENDAEYNSRYYNLYRNEALAGLAGAVRVNSAIQGLGRLSQTLGRAGDINVPIGEH